MAATRKTKAKPRLVADQVAGAMRSNADKFELTARRVIGAVEELNQAMEEAHKNQEMRVEFWPVESKTLPRQYQYRIYQLTHTVMRWTVAADEAGKVVARYEPKTAKPEDQLSVAANGGT